MPTSISTSETSTPSIISLRTAWIYQRAGSTAEMACKITGILSMGNIMPESNMVGIISISPDTSIAATCVRVTVEISSPSARETKMNSSDTTTSQNKLPATGTSST